MAELLLDPNIRLYVFIPIVLICLFVGLIRHYVTILLESDKKTELSQVADTHLLRRARLLRENGNHIPRDAFMMRRHYFNGPNGVLKVEKQSPAAANPMTDPSMMADMMKGNLTNMIPMVVIGGWINWTFSGFVTTKVPFALTLRFKDMLQRGVQLTTLDASWVSSASWYFINVFGLRSIYSLFLGPDNEADQSMMMATQMTAPGAPPDMKKAYKEEWEALEVRNHRWSLENITDHILYKNNSVDSSYQIAQKAL
ncbi:hypothetical protein ACHWQZ_G000908 [Mnemiopsis leidyi]